MPENPELTPLIEIGPFQGINLWQSPWHMPHNVLTDMSFMQTDESLGALAIAKGRGTIAGGLTDPLGLDVFYRDTGQPYAITVADGVWKLIDYVGAVAPVNFTLPASGWDAAAQTYFVLAGSSDFTQLLGFNGLSTPLTVLDNFNPAAPTARKAGLTTPASAPTPAAGAAGNLNGTYRYRVTFESSSHESSPGEISDPITVTNQQVTLTGIATSSDPATTSRNVWRIGGSVPEWRLVGTISDNATTTATDNISDLDLGRLLDFDRDPPPAALTVVVYHKQRVFGFIGDKLRWSNFDEPEGWDPTNELPVGRGDAIVTLGTTGSVLLVFKRGQTWGLFGETLADFVSVKLFDVGCVGPRAVCSAPGEVYWLSEDGLRKSNGRSIELIGAPFYTFIRDLPSAAKQTATMVYGSGKVFISFPDLSGDFAGFAHWCLIYDLKTQQWERYPFPARQVVALFAAISSDPGFFAWTELTDPSPTYSIRKWPNTYADLGADIDWYFERQEASPPNTAKLVKVFRELEIEAPAQVGVEVTVILTVDDDVVNKQATLTVPLTNAPVRVGLPHNIRGRYIKIRVSGSHQRKVIFHSVRIWGWIERGYSRDAA